MRAEVSRRHDLSGRPDDPARAGPMPQSFLYTDQEQWAEHT